MAALEAAFSFLKGILVKSKSITLAIVAVLALGCVAAFAGHPITAYVPHDLLASIGLAGAMPFMVGETVDMKSLADAVEKSNRAFEEWKKTVDTKIETMLKGGTTADLDAKLHKIFDDMGNFKKLIEDIEAKAKRPNVGGGADEAAERDREAKGAFRDFIRIGKGYDQLKFWAPEEAKSLSITSGPDGGYAVPKVIDGMIEAIAVNISPIRSIATVQQTSTTDFHKLVNVRGTSSGWVGDGQARGSTNTSQFKDINPPMGELYAYPQATQQMLDDVFFNAEQWIADEVATEFARAEGAAHVSGNGVNQPLGFLSGSAPVSTADATRTFGVLQYTPTGKSGAFADLSSTVNPADALFTLVGTMKAAYRKGSCWVLPKAILFEMMSFKDYQGRYVFNPMTAPGTQDTILGYPIVEAEDMPAKGANSYSVAFGNFKLGYLIVDRIGTRVVRDPFTNKPYIGFYVTKRSGGTLMNSEAIKVLKFSAS